MDLRIGLFSERLKRAVAGEEGTLLGCLVDFNLSRLLDNIMKFVMPQ